MTELHSREIVPLRDDEGGHLRSPYVFRGADRSDWHSKPVSSGCPVSGRTTAKQSSDRSSEASGSMPRLAYLMTNPSVRDGGGAAQRPSNALLGLGGVSVVAVHFACSDETRKAEDASCGAFTLVR